MGPGERGVRAGGWGGELNPAVQWSSPEILGTGFASKEERERAAQLFLLPAEALGGQGAAEEAGRPPASGLLSQARAPPYRSLQSAEQRGVQLPEEQGRVWRTQQKGAREGWGDGLCEWETALGSGVRWTAMKQTETSEHAQGFLCMPVGSLQHGIQRSGTTWCTEF